MKQFQAGYILEAVKELLTIYSRKKNIDINGLLSSLSTFNVETSLNLGPSTKIPSILAVASNILTRGLPTLGNVYVEEYFADKLGLTKRVDDAERGKICFPFIEDPDPKDLYKALHIIDPRARNRSQYLNVTDVDSGFERSFLSELIPDNYAFLTQLLERQRLRSSFTRDNNQGRIDFSIEIPYDKVGIRTNKFKNQVQIKHHKTYVVEVDGKAYHSKLIDDLKDFEIAQLSRDIKHITEDRTHKDVNEFLNGILNEDYVNLIAENFRDESYLSNPFTSIVLSPFGVARVQRILLQYLISNYEKITDGKKLKLAIVERDLPCAYVAVNDLFKLLHTLNELAQTQISLPEIELEVFTCREFKSHPLNTGINVKAIDTLRAQEFDLVIDISVLRREGIFKEDKQPASNTILIRSSHYIHYQTVNGVLSAPGIKYRSVVAQPSNEITEPIEETSTLLKELLQNIFRKINFREGQLPILNRALQLKSVIGLLPTGGGKSLTYQLAAMLQPGTTIVIDPIRSLMIDQYNGLREIGIDKCEFINSTLTTAERNYNQHNLLAKGQLQFLFVSPERFVIDEFRKALDNAAKDGFYFSYAVIDEVHCVSEWGHDFRTPYLNLGDNAQKYCLTYSGGSEKNTIPLFGLTATASFDVLADIERELNIKEDDGNAIVRSENTVRDEINYSIIEVKNEFEGLDNLTEKAIRESIGRRKQETVFELIANKEQSLGSFNNVNAVTDILHYSFENYVPLGKRQKFQQEVGTGNDPIEKYIETGKKKLLIQGNPFENYDNVYKYGLIVFMPHRQGWLGIRNGYNSHGVFDNPDFINNNNSTIHNFKAETFGYFMGSGDDDAADKVDTESFHHLDQFKENKESVMVATKAFGMGIDKPNVRMTIHINIPQSIESFVQEAGRAGRDGKISTSVILFNNELLKVSDRPDEIFHLDKDILMYFHKNSFKGQIKERVMIYELRSRVTFPNTTQKGLIEDQLNEFHGNDEIQFKFNIWKGTAITRLYINLQNDSKIGYISLDNGNCINENTSYDSTFCYSILEFVKEKLPFNLGSSEIVNWLSQAVVSTQQQMGLEKMLADMKMGETKELPIPFTNRYYSKRAKSKMFFILNDAHLQKFLQTQAVKDIIESERINPQIITNQLRDAVFNGADYEEFIASLNIKNSTLIEQLLDLGSPISLDLQRAYFLPRSQEDTAKAIYRLISIGIIDSYHIDYQNQLYTVTFTKKKDQEYFNALEELIGRYSSKNMAKQEVEKLMKDTNQAIKLEKASTLSVCLEYLTDFIYDKIKAKRLQAIKDMVELCRTSISINDPLEQNKYVKDEIYYYFNAKYSRVGFIEKWTEVNKKGQLVELEQAASLPDDLDLAIDKTIDKYISLAENEATGEFINNIKHLRGSTMRMLRSYPDKPQYRILKAFTLFILADRIKDLVNEAKEELTIGLMDWKKLNETLNVSQYIIDFKNKLKSHVLLYDVDVAFDDIEDLYYSLYYSNWLTNFNNRFLQL